MAKRLRFTSAWLDSLRPPEKGRVEYSDSTVAGLQLRVTDKGTKSFSVVYWSRNGTQRRTLGRYPQMSLREARIAASEILEAAEETQEEPEEKWKLGTVEDLFKEVIAAMRAAKMRSADNYEYDLLTGKGCAADAFGRDTLAKDVTPSMVTKWLRKRHKGVGSGMDHARAHCSAAFARGMRMDYDPKRPNDAVRYQIESNPVTPVATAGSLGRTRNRVLDIEELAIIWHMMPYAAGPAMAHLFRLLIAMGGVRVSEVLESKRSWWNLDGEPKLTLPDTKTGREHELPITDAALPSLRLLFALSEDIAAGWPDPEMVPWLMPGEGKKGPIVPMALTSVSRAANRLTARFHMEDWQPRDIRRSMKTHLLDLDIDDRDIDVWHDHGRNADVARKHYDRARRWRMKLRVKEGIEEIMSMITQPCSAPLPGRPSAPRSER